MVQITYLFTTLTLVLNTWKKKSRKGLHYLPPCTPISETFHNSSLSKFFELSFYGNRMGYNKDVYAMMYMFQYFGYLMRRTDSLEKTLMLGKIEGRRRREQQRMRWLDGITKSTDMSLSKLQSWWRSGTPGMLQSMGSHKESDTTKQLNWTDPMTL